MKEQPAEGGLARRVLDFWFGPPDDPARHRQRSVWFEKDETFDAAIRAGFARDVEAAAAGRHADLAATPEGAVALVILLDQFTRNLFRGDARSYDCDEAAWQAAARAIGRGFDRPLSPVARQFLYMPYQHAEDGAIQDRSVQLYHHLGLEKAFRSAIAHRAIVPSCHRRTVRPLSAPQ